MTTLDRLKKLEATRRNIKIRNTIERIKKCSEGLNSWGEIMNEANDQYFKYFLESTTK
jgi:hypothetical protein